MSEAVEQDLQKRQLPEGYPERIPDFTTEEEIRDFWDTHDSSYYWDQGEDVTNNPPPELKRGPGRAGSRALKRPEGEGERMGLVSLRMGDDMVAAVKEVAARRHLPYQTLMRSWVAERLEQEQRALSSESDGKDTDGARRLG